MHSDDILAHYGVKGMKWHKKHAANGNPEGAYNDHLFNHNFILSDGKTTITSYGQNQRRKDIAADKRQMHQHVNETNPYKIDRSQSLKKNVQSNIQVHKDRKQLKKIADKTVDRYYNGKDKKKRKPLTKDSFKRERPKGKKLKGGGNIYVSHDTTIKTTRRS